MVHAIGNILARTWYESTQPVELRVVERSDREEKDNISFVFVLEKDKFIQ